MPRLVTLGRFELVGAKAEIRPAATQPKRLALLAYLATSGAGVFHRRDALLALLWPELGPEESRRALRQALHYLRKHVGDTCILARADDQVGLAEGGLESDIADLERSVIDGRDEDALALYRGPFLDAVHIPDASTEFEEWVTRTRARLARQATRAAWRVCEKAQSAGDGAAAVAAARRAHELSPDDEAGLRRLLGVLQGQADHAGALNVFETFASRMAAQYGAAPSSETMSIIEGIRTRPPLGRPPVPAVIGIKGNPPRDARPPVDVGGIPEFTGAPPIPPRKRRRTTRAATAVILLALTLAVGLLARGAWARDDRAPVLAVGWFENEASDSTGNTARVLRGLLATDLARIEGISVVSASRLLEILGRRASDETAASVADAAKRLGATELLEGTLYRRGTMLRLDVRRIDLGRGVVRGVYTAEEADPFSLVSHLTTQVARALALPPPATPLAGGGTGSLAARTLYEQGLRMLYRGDASGAFNLFLAALVEDSTFAMAAYHAARTASPSDPDSSLALMERADRLAAQAPTRDRLLIRVGRTYDQYATGLAVAESLVARFPSEPEGLVQLGHLRIAAGDFLGAVPLARRVLAMDSGGVNVATVQCWSCEAYGVLAAAYLGADSLPAEERITREFLRRYPTSAAAWFGLHGTLARQGRGNEALAALRAVTKLMPERMFTVERGRIALFQDDPAEAERILRARLREDERDLDALWLLLITLRQQGRLAEAEAIARPLVTDGTEMGWIWHATQIQFERGRYRQAAITFDSTAHVVRPLLRRWPGLAARVQSWAHTHAATSLAAAGDTARLTSLADSIEAVAPLSSYGRDWRLPHHVRGLLWQARGEPEKAVEAFRAAMYSPTLGYTRTNLELARSLLALGRPAEAVRILRSAFHGSLDASNLYVTRTELHELQARAFEAAGQPDSAAAHYRVVTDSWSAGDAPFRARADSARNRLRALRR